MSEGDQDFSPEQKDGAGQSAPAHVTGNGRKDKGDAMRAGRDGTGGARDGGASAAENEALFGAARGAVNARRLPGLLLSFKANAYIGCLEYLLLSLLGALAPFLLLLLWGGGLFGLAALTAPAGGHASSAFGVFSAIAALLLLLVWALLLLACAFYQARLLQLRFLDIGLGDTLAVPSLAGNFWCCFGLSLIGSLYAFIYPFGALGLLLFVFCCVCPGKTAKDNRDLFRPIEELGAEGDVLRQIHARKE